MAPFVRLNYDSRRPSNTMEHVKDKRMWNHWELDDAELHRMLRSGQIQWGGNLSAKIYGTLRCGGGKRLLRTNRVFFASEDEARAHGFRPCGNCMRAAYRQYLLEHAATSKAG